ncbi:MAGUK p55 subfamily member 4-like [Trematomus bernacchii]|uniref:MAGUK p55 subfamily member 4-like n=1 Tax=Trematomus bernacchii TaxID=40690 RepID=UPI00146CF43C|nr:MAGUK p55 subfamily member 4-like [Trematomus bernacchii]
MRQTIDEGVSEVLSCVVEDVGHAVSRNVGGAELLHELLNAPWLRSLLQIYECLLDFEMLTPTPLLPYASGLSHEIMSAVQMIQHPSAEARELHCLLSSPHIQALLSSHDSVAQADFGPVLPPLPDDMAEDEEAMRIVCLVKNNQPLGATIRRDEETGAIYIARVIHGGLADRSRLLHAGDLLVEVNGNPVAGLEPEQVIQILMNSHGTILFKVIPDAAQSSGNSQKTVFMKAMVDYCPLLDTCSPCPPAGMMFSRGELLQVVDQSDARWWQARKISSSPMKISSSPSSSSTCAGIIPSASMLRSKQRENWWSQPLQVHTCIKPLTVGGSADNIQTPADEHLPATDEADSDVTDGIYLAGFRRSFRLWRRTSYRRRRQSCSSCSPDTSSLCPPYEEVALYQRPPQENHRLIILLGATRVGVNELRKSLIKLNPSSFQSPVPHTTRPMKAGEQTGREYHFITRELFEYMVCNHRFVEYGEFKGQLYGTSTDSIDDVLRQARMCIIDVEPHSIQPLRSKKLKPFVIFIKPPAADRLRETRRNARILSSCRETREFREEDFVDLEETSRLIEEKYKQFFDFTLENNELQESCRKLCSIIKEAQEEEQWIPVSWSREEE